jgi:hypothetical protein
MLPGEILNPRTEERKIQMNLYTSFAVPESKEVLKKRRGYVDRTQETN